MPQAVLKSQKSPSRFLNSETVRLLPATGVALAIAVRELLALASLAAGLGAGLILIAGGLSTFSPI